jgi:hypothetical protein
MSYWDIVTIILFTVAGCVVFAVLVYAIFELTEKVGSWAGWLAGALFLLCLIFVFPWIVVVTS